MKRWSSLILCALLCSATTATYAQPKEEKPTDSPRGTPSDTPRRGGRGGGGFGGGFGVGGQRSLVDLASQEAVMKELEINEESQGKLKKLRDEAAEKNRENMAGFQGIRELEGEERTKKMAEMGVKMAAVNALIDPKVAEVLSATQMTRLKEIKLQIAGSAALQDAEVVKSLELTPAQQEEFAKVQKTFAEKQGGLGRDVDFQERMTKTREMSEARDKEAEAILTAVQKEKLAKMKGKTFDVASLRGPGRGGPGGPGGGPNPGGRPRRAAE